MTGIRSNKDVADEIRNCGLASPELLNRWANCIDPDGFIVTGLDVAGLVRHLAERGQCYEVLKELCGVFGVELYASEDVRNMLEAKFVISDVTRELIRQHIERDRHGLAKYGTTLDRTDLDRNAWLQHLAEELMDGAGYALAAKRS
jgi:hypothetical protein